MEKYHKNPRTLTKKQGDSLRASLEELGDLSGIVHDVNSDEIVGGNQRSEIMNVNLCEIELAYEWDAPDVQGTLAGGYLLWKGKRYAYRRVSWTPEQCEKANVVANKAGGNWDFDILANDFELTDLLEWGFEPFELGIEEPKPKAGDDTAPQMNRADELRVKWGVELGQIWQLGAHRIICGDSTDVNVVVRLMAGEDAEMVWTDPPYGVGIGVKNARLNALDYYGRDGGDLLNDALSEPEISEMLTDAFRCAASVCKPGGAWYITGPPGPLHVLTGKVLKDMGIWRQTITWVKNSPTIVPMTVDYRWQAEPVFYGWLPGAGHRFYGGRSQSTVWEIDRPHASPEHPTMKPLELVERAVRNSSNADELVYDPFVGSGTTIIACENLGRKCMAVELAPGYVAVSLERWSEHTGHTPLLLQDGQPTAQPDLLRPDHDVFEGVAMPMLDN